jgi:hypothetical protein
MDFLLLGNNFQFWFGKGTKSSFQNPATLHWQFSAWKEQWIVQSVAAKIPFFP